MALTPLNTDANPQADDAEKKVLYWWDPMLGPTSISDHPGKSAMGMDLVPVYGNQTEAVVQIDPRVVQNMGVRTAEVTIGKIHRSVRAVGSIALSEPGLHDVSLKVAGWIEKLNANQEGMHIAEGDLLFEVYSPELQVASQELISAEKVLRDLPAGSPPAVRSEAQAFVDTSRRKLRLWDVSDTDIDAIQKSEKPLRTTPFKSQFSGDIEQKMIVQGAAIQPGMRLLQIADHTRMWLDIQVYADDISLITLGQVVTATVEGVPGKSFTGKVGFIYPHLDHVNRTMRVRVTLDNPSLELKPGMYATVEILTRSPERLLICPREAVIDTGEQQLVFVSKGGGRFSARQVVVGIAGDDDKVQIVSGLTPGELVVTSGQFLMDAESRTIEATQKLENRTEDHSSTMKEMP